MHIFVQKNFYVVMDNWILANADPQIIIIPKFRKEISKFNSLLSFLGLSTVMSIKMIQTQLQMSIRIIQINVKKIDYQFLVNTTKKCFFPILDWISTKL